MKLTLLRRLPEFGQSVWLDFISRETLTSGELQRLIEEDGISGVTSNPKIFADAIRGGTDYDADIQLGVREQRTAKAIYETLALQDIRCAADLFRPIYETTRGAEGYVSLEVSPELAYETAATIEEARRLWKSLDRPNVLIKIPATQAGLPAIREMISEGININSTLLFSVERYREVAEAYLAGLEERQAQGRPIDRIQSIASFFVSRIDVLLDPLLEAAAGCGGTQGAAAGRARGRAAIACAKLAYQASKEIFSGGRFGRLARNGASPQRLLWASTSTKDPTRSDLAYVEPLIGPHTINTMPRQTLAAYRDHGNPAARLEEGVPEARQVIQSVATAGIDLARIAAQLEAEGVRKFKEPFEALLAGLEQKRLALATA